MMPSGDDIAIRFGHAMVMRRMLEDVNPSTRWFVPCLVDGRRLPLSSTTCKKVSGKPLEHQQQ